MSSECFLSNNAEPTNSNINLKVEQMENKGGWR